MQPPLPVTHAKCSGLRHSTTVCMRTDHYKCTLHRCPHAVSERLQPEAMIVPQTQARTCFPVHNACVALPAGIRCPPEAGSSAPMPHLAELSCNLQ